MIHNALSVKFYPLAVLRWASRCSFSHMDKQKCFKFSISSGPEATQWFLPLLSSLPEEAVSLRPRTHWGRNTHIQHTCFSHADRVHTQNYIKHDCMYFLPWKSNRIQMENLQNNTFYICFISISNHLFSFHVLNDFLLE